jgi:hypothetical protein
MNVCSCRIDKDEHSAKWYARSEPGQPLEQEHRDSQGVIVPTGNSKEQRWF